MMIVIKGEMNIYDNKEKRVCESQIDLVFSTSE